MKRTILKPILAATLVVASLGTLAQAKDRTLMLQRGSDVMIRMPTLARDLTTSGPVTMGPLMKIQLHFNCASRGTPVEFPNDIAIWHDYGFTVAAGTTVKYVAAFGNTGIAILPAIPAGKQVFISNVVPGGVTPETPCTATQM